MKRFLFIGFLSLVRFAIAQPTVNAYNPSQIPYTPDEKTKVATIGTTATLFQNFASLRNQKSTFSYWGLVRYGSTVNDKLGGVFYWDSTSTLADDNKKIIANAGWVKGRYIKLEPLTQARGLFSVSSVPVGTQTFTIAHGLSSTPTNVQYSFQSSAPLSVGTSWTSDASNIYIKVNTLAIIGAMSISWIAYID